MTATTLFYLLICLVLGIWALVVISFWYGRRLLHRQSLMISDLLVYLRRIDQDCTTIRSLSIPDSIPLSKLQDVTLPDNVQVDFQHHSRGE